MTTQLETARITFQEYAKSFPPHTDWEVFAKSLLIDRAQVWHKLLFVTIEALEQGEMLIETLAEEVSKLIEGKYHDQYPFKDLPSNIPICAVEHAVYKIIREDRIPHEYSTERVQAESDPEKTPSFYNEEWVAPPRLS